MDKPIWEPSDERIANANLTAFMAAVERDWGRAVEGYPDLYEFSIDRPDCFWTSVWDFCGVIAEHRGEEVVRFMDRMPGAQWFPGARLNFAQNLLRRRDSSDALVYLREDRGQRGGGAGVAGRYADRPVRAATRAGAPRRRPDPENRYPPSHRRLAPSRSRAGHSGSGHSAHQQGIVAAGLFGFTLSCDEFARATLLAGEYNTLPLDINASMTQRIRPALFALGRRRRCSRC